jgi:lipopolysaccharide transport system ATP-binding protein
MRGSPKEVTEAYFTEYYPKENATNINASTTHKISKNPLEPAENIKLFHPPSLLPTDSQIISDGKEAKNAQLFRFDENGTTFGNPEAKILQIKLKDREGVPIQWILGGEIVNLELGFAVNKEPRSLVVGFAIKDQTGQLIISDESFLFPSQIRLNASDPIENIISFEFQMPILRAGLYTIDGMIASNPDTVEHSEHWLHDGCVVQSLSRSLSTGLIGLPMLSVELSGQE